MEAIILANRLKYEEKNMKNYPKFKLEINNENPLIRFVFFEGDEKTLDANEKFKVKIEFSNEYVII